MTAVYGLVNARNIRLRRVTVKLSGLPENWRGRQALLVSDLHLGHVNGLAFARRIAQMVRDLNPAIVFLPGDMFDGSKVDLLQVAAPLLELKPPLGMYFVGGNHEEFGGAAHFEGALRGGRSSRAAQRMRRRGRFAHGGRGVWALDLSSADAHVSRRTAAEGRTAQHSAESCAEPAAVG